MAGRDARERSHGWVSAVAVAATLAGSALALLGASAAQATPTVSGRTEAQLGRGPHVLPLRVENPQAYAKAKAAAANAYARWRQQHGRPTTSAAPDTVVAGSLNQPGLDANVDGRNLTPPDTTGAIGPSNYVEFVNSEVAVYSRTTLANPPVAEPESTFVNSSAETCDGQIQWDQQGQRWLYAVLDCNASAGNETFYFGWSKTPSPSLAASNWCRYTEATGISLEDYPKLGHDNSQLIIGTNAFDDGTLNYTGSNIWVFDKPAPGVTTCPANSALDATHLKVTLANDFTPVPADIADGSASGYVAAEHNYPSNQLTLFQVGRNAGGHNALLSTTLVTVPAFDIPANVPQLAPGTEIDSSDTRLTQAVAVTDPTTGKEGIWTQHTVAPLGGGPSVVRWYELTPGAISPRQTGTVAGPSGTFAFNGAVSPTSDGKSAVVFYNSGDGSHLVDLRAQDRRPGTPLGHTVEDLHLGTSVGIDDDFSCGFPSCRWGDYAGATPDPANASLVWGTGELTTLTADGLQSAQWGSRNVAIDTSTRPAVSLSGATPVGTTTATLHGAVNPEGDATTYHFEYGTTTAYGHATPATSAGAGKSTVSESASITGLAPGTTYHFRLVATNVLGTVTTSDRTFVTTTLPKLCVVPKVKGKKLRAAKRAIRKANCSVGKVRRVFSARMKRGRVLSSSPRAGASRPDGAKVRLKVSKGKRKHR